MKTRTLCIVMGGGRGTRIFPLTKYRSKPAVPLGGKYRLIDVAISSCLNSGFNKILVLTQYNSESLNKHIGRTYKLDDFSRGFVEILAAEQSYENTEWFQGTADAVRRSLLHLNDPSIEEVIVLSGDQLFTMDLAPFQAYHIKKQADFSVACHPVAESEVSQYGIMQIDNKDQVKAFLEKPQNASAIHHKPMEVAGKPHYLASMGIYIFRKEILKKILTESDKDDFGKEIIPDAIKTQRAHAYIYKDYWVDVGTIRSYYNANLMMTERWPRFDLYNEEWPIYTRPRFLPPAKMENCKVLQSIIAEGCVLEEDTLIEHSVIGVRSRIGKGTQIKRSVLAGQDFYERQDHVPGRRRPPQVPLGIGEKCLIEGAIIDKNARIGNEVRIVNEHKKDEADGPGYTIRDGIVVIHKGAVIKDGVVI